MKMEAKENLINKRKWPSVGKGPQSGRFRQPNHPIHPWWGQKQSSCPSKKRRRVWTDGGRPQQTVFTARKHRLTSIIGSSADWYVVASSTLLLLLPFVCSFLKFSLLSVLLFYFLPLSEFFLFFLLFVLWRQWTNRRPVGQTRRPSNQSVNSFVCLCSNFFVYFLFIVLLLFIFSFLLFLFVYAQNFL